MHCAAVMLEALGHCLLKPLGEDTVDYAVKLMNISAGRKVCQREGRAGQGRESSCYVDVSHPPKNPPEIPIRYVLAAIFHQFLWKQEGLADSFYKHSERTAGLLRSEAGFLGERSLE